MNASENNAITESLDKYGVLGSLRKYNIFLVFMLLRFAEWYFSRPKKTIDIDDSEAIIKAPDLPSVPKLCPICNKP